MSHPFETNPTPSPDSAPATPDAHSVPTLTNSPHCIPHYAPHPDPTEAESTRATASPTPSPTPTSTARPAPPRRRRVLRVDAWAEPASTNWTRTRRTVRKVRRKSRTPDWALPF